MHKRKPSDSSMPFDRVDKVLFSEPGEDLVFLGEQKESSRFDTLSVPQLLLR